MNMYKHGNWYCKPANEAEAREIIERAVGSGAVDHNRGRFFDSSHYGVFNGIVFPAAGIEYTIDEVREKFPLSGEHEWNSEGSPRIGWHGECSPNEIKWHECVILPDGFIAYSYILHEKKFWDVASIDGLIFRPIRSERERWVEDAISAAGGKQAVKTEQQMEIEELEAVIAKAQQRIKELKPKHV